MSSLESLVNIDYDEMVSSTNYTATKEFDPGDLRPFYDMTVSFMETLFPVVVPPELHVDDGGIQVADDDYLGLAKHYVSILTLFVFVCLFAILTPLIGTCFCCCRCCCSDDKKLNKMNKKHEQKLCKKVTFSFILIMCIALFMVCLVGAYGSNQTMHEGTGEIVKSLKTITENTLAFFEEAKDNINIILEDNYKKLNDGIVGVLDESPQLIYEGIRNITNAQSIQEIFVVVETLKTLTTSDLNDLQTESQDLTTNFNDLKQNVNDAKENLKEALEDCSDELCNQIKEEVEKLQMADITLPSMDDEINTIKSFVSNGILDSIESAKGELAKIEEQIETSSKDQIKTIKDKMAETGTEILEQKDKIFTTIEDITDAMDNVTDDALSLADEYLDEYKDIPYFVDLALACVILFIVVLLVLGLVLGLFCSPETICCNQRTMLSWAVIVIFISSFFVGVLLLLHLPSAIVHVFLCEPMRNPLESDTFKFYNDSLDMERYLNLNVSLGRILINVHDGNSLYETFDLQEIFDVDELSEYIERFEIEKQLEALKEQIKVETGNMEFIDQENLDKIAAFADDMSNIDKNLEDTLKALELADFSKIPIDLLIEQIETLLEVPGNLPNKQKLKAAKENLLKCKDLLKGTETNVKDLKLVVQKISKDLQLGQGSFKDGLLALRDSIIQAQKDIKDNENIIKVIEQFARGTVEAVERFLKMVIKNVKYDLGKTAPLSMVINDTLTSTCDFIVLPMGGFALSLLWCIVIFIPTLIFAICLSNL